MIGLKKIEGKTQNKNHLATLSSYLRFTRKNRSAQKINT